jgi:protein-S-isoprenylcysteine O-methyltransferase Ste14
MAGLRAFLESGAAATPVKRLARLRVTLGFLFGALTLWFAEPTWFTLAAGAAVTTVGEAVRLWAAGHVEKSREITRSGPYGLIRHPLYLGSAIIGAGVAVASGNVLVGVLIVLYLTTTIPAAIVAEEAHLREKFGDDYDAYANRQAPAMARRFSWARARVNREHHTIAGVIIGFALLALKVELSIR